MPPKSAKAPEAADRANSGLAKVSGTTPKQSTTPPVEPVRKPEDMKPPEPIDRQQLLRLLLLLEDEDSKVRELYKELNLDQFRQSSEGDAKLEGTLLDSSSPRAKALAGDNTDQEYRHVVENIRLVQEFFHRPEYAAVDRLKIARLDFDGTNIKKQHIELRDLRDFLTLIVKECTTSTGDKVDEASMLHERVRICYESFAKSHPEKLVEVNGHPIIRVGDFEEFMATLSKYLDSLQYFERFGSLRHDLEKVKGLFPINLPKSFDKDNLFLEFVFKNQKGVHLDDVEMIFKILQVETYHRAALTRGFSILVKESFNYSSNQQKIVSFLNKNKDKAIDVFSQYKNTQNKVSMNDYLLVMRDMKSIDPNLHFYENRADVEDFLSKTNALKSTLDHAKQYFFEYLGLSRTLYPRVNSIDIGYDVFWEFFDYLLKMAADFYIEYNLGGEAENLFRLRRELEDTVDKYKRKLHGCQSEFEEGVVRSTIKNFEDQLRDLDTKIRAQSDVVVREKRRDKVLKDVYDFYCKQHISGGNGADTFEGIGNNKSHMSVGDWMCFHRDFGVRGKNKLSVKTLTDIFKTYLRGRDLITFEEFKLLLGRVAEELAVNVPFLKTPQQKLESLYEYLDLMDPKIHKRLKQNGPAFRGVGPVVGPSPKEKEDAEIQRLFRERQDRKMAKILRAKVPDSIIALANTKLKKDINFDPMGNRVRDNVNTSLVKHPDQSRTQHQLHSQGIRKPQIVYPLREASSRANLKTSRNSYLLIEKKKHMPESVPRVNWQSLENMKPNDLKGFLDEDFEPNDLIGNDDPEDNEYLSAFNLHAEEATHEDRRARKAAELKNYGSTARHAVSRLPPLPSKAQPDRREPNKLRLDQAPNRYPNNRESRLPLVSNI